MDRRGRQPTLLCHSHCHSLWFLENEQFIKIFLLFDSIIDLKKVVFAEVVKFCGCFPFLTIPFNYLQKVCALSQEKKLGFQ